MVGEKPPTRWYLWRWFFKSLRGPYLRFAPMWDQRDCLVPELEYSQIRSQKELQIQVLLRKCNDVALMSEKKSFPNLTWYLIR